MYSTRRICQEGLEVPDDCPHRISCGPWWASGLGTWQPLGFVNQRGHVELSSSHGLASRDGMTKIGGLS